MTSKQIRIKRTEVYFWAFLPVSYLQIVALFTFCMAEEDVAEMIDVLIGTIDPAAQSEVGTRRMTRVDNGDSGGGPLKY